MDTNHEKTETQIKKDEKKTKQLRGKLKKNKEDKVNKQIRRQLLHVPAMEGLGSHELEMRRG